MKKTKIISALIFLLVVPATLILGSKMNGRWYYLTSTLIIAELLIPFFLAFEALRLSFSPPCSYPSRWGLTGV